MPTVTFGSEVWICSEKDEDLLLSFQRYMLVGESRGFHLDRLMLAAFMASDG